MLLKWCPDQCRRCWYCWELW